MNECHRKLLTSGRKEYQAHIEYGLEENVLPNLTFCEASKEAWFYSHEENVIGRVIDSKTGEIFKAYQKGKLVWKSAHLGRSGVRRIYNPILELVKDELKVTSSYDGPSVLSNWLMSVCEYLFHNYSGMTYMNC